MAQLPHSKSKYNGSNKPEIASTKFFTAEISRPAQAAVASASPVQTFPSTFNTRAQNAEEPTKDRGGKAEDSKTTTSRRAIDTKAMGKVSANAVHNAGEAKKSTKVDQASPSRPSNPFAKSSSNQDAKVDQVSSSRPSNPFAKSSSNQESPSLFDSLKKMKKTDVKGKS